MLKSLAPDNTTAILAALEEDGACIIGDMLDSATCDALLDDFAGTLDNMAWGVDELGYRNDFYGSRTKRVHGLFEKSTHMADVLLHPVITGIAQAMFVETRLARDIRLSNAELMALGEHQGPQMFHTDGASWPYLQGKLPHEILVSVNYALTPFTATNGATRVVPGSHKWQPGREPAEDEISQAIMPRGSALVYTGNVVHSGGANEEGELRCGLYLGYIPSWLRPIENQLVTNDPQAIAALPERAQLMLDVAPGGFTVFA